MTTGKWIAEGRVAIYLAKEVCGAEGDGVEAVANTNPLPEQAHDIVEIVERSGYVRVSRVGAYHDAWKKLHSEVLNERTGWGKEQLKERMDRLLIECMELYL